MTLATPLPSCLPRIRASLRGAPKSAIRVAEFVLASAPEVRSMSMESLAGACRTSSATVSRFCKRLGYGSFREFQLDLAADLAQKDEITLDDFSEDAGPDAIIQQVFDCNRQSLDETARLVDRASLAAVAQRIRKARRSLFMGIGASALVARQAAERFLSLGLIAESVDDPYHQIFATANANIRDVVVGISHSGENIHVVESVRAAGERGAVTVALTNYPNSPLAKAARYQLITAYREHRVNVAISSSTIAQMCVVDSLYFLVGSWLRRSARRLATDAERRAQALLRRRS